MTAPGNEARGSHLSKIRTTSSDFSVLLIGLHFSPRTWHIRSGRMFWFFFWKKWLPLLFCGNLQKNLLQIRLSSTRFHTPSDRTHNSSDRHDDGPCTILAVSHYKFNSNSSGKNPDQQLTKKHEIGTPVFIRTRRSTRHRLESNLAWKKVMRLVY